MRITKKIVPEILAMNEGKSWKTNNKIWNETRIYRILNGVLYLKRNGHTSWADSDYDHYFPLNLEDTRKALYDFKNLLKLPNK